MGTQQEPGNPRFTRVLADGYLKQWREPFAELGYTLTLVGSLSERNEGKDMDVLVTDTQSRSLVQQEADFFDAIWQNLPGIDTYVGKKRQSSHHLNTWFIKCLLLDRRVVEFYFTDPDYQKGEET